MPFVTTIDPNYRHNQKPQADRRREAEAHALQVNYAPLAPPCILSFAPPAPALTENIEEADANFAAPAPPCIMSFKPKRGTGG